MNEGRNRRVDTLSFLAASRGPALTGYAYLLTGNLRDAEDLVQDALVKTFRRIGGVEAGAAETYVRRAILTLYIDGYRRRRRWEGIRHLLARADELEPTDDVSCAQVDVQRALRTLPPQQRACVVLRFYEDMTITEIAAQMRLAEGTVKRYLSLAMKYMASALGP